MPAAPQVQDEGSIEFDLGSGEARLWLAARDPHTLHVTWDLTPAQSQAAAGRLAVRIRSATAPDLALQQVEVGDRIRSAFVHVEHPGSRYEAEIGFHEPGGIWHTFAAATPVSTPPQRAAAAGKPKFVQVVIEPVGSPDLTQPPAEPTSPPSVPVRAELPHSPPVSEESAAPPPRSAQSTPAPPPMPPAVISAPVAPAPSAPEPPPPAPVPAARPVEAGTAPSAVPPPEAGRGIPETPGPAPTVLTQARETPVSIEAGPASAAPSSPPPAGLSTAVEPRTSVGAGSWYPSAAPPTWRVHLVEMPAPVLSLAEEQMFRELAGLTGATITPELPSSPGLPPLTVPGMFAPGGFAAGRPPAGVAGAGLPSSEAVIPPSGGAVAPRGFWFNINAELIVYGATEADAHVTIDGEAIRLRPDGTFTLRFALPDGDYGLAAVAVSAAGDDSRAARLQFLRRTAYRGGVGKHPTDPSLAPPPEAKGPKQA